MEIVIALFMLIFVHKLDLINLFELYKEESMWNTKPIGKRYCYIKTDQGKVYRTTGVTNKKQINNLTIMSNNIIKTGDSKWLIIGEYNLTIEKGEEVDLIMFSKDSSYAKIKVHGRWGGNCYVPAFFLHDTLPSKAEMEASYDN